jgi:hypothetical protein
LKAGCKKCHHQPDLCPVFAITPLFSHTIFSSIFDISDFTRTSCVLRGQNIGREKIRIFATFEIPYCYDKPVFFAGSCSAHDGFQKYRVMAKESSKLQVAGSEKNP